MGHITGDDTGRSALIDAHIAEGERIYASGDFSVMPALLDKGAELAPGLDTDDDLRLRSHLLLSATMGRWSAPPWLIELDPTRLPLERPAQRMHALMLAAELSERAPDRASGVALNHEVAERAVAAIDGPASDPIDVDWLLDTASYLAAGERLADAELLLRQVPPPASGPGRLKWLHRHALISLRRGEVGKALDYGERLASEGGHLPWYAARADEYRVLALGLSGRDQDAADLVTSAVARRPEDVALQLLAADTAGDAERLLAAVPDVLAFQPSRLQPHLRAARAQLRLGRSADARASLRLEIALQEACGTPGMKAEAQALLAQTLPDGAGVLLLEEALSLARHSERHHSQDTVLIAWADHLFARGDLRASRRGYADALDLAAADERAPAMVEAERRLRRVGGRPRRLRTTGPTALTPAQRAVAELAAAGLTNVLIARELWLTEKTVETHLRASFRILRITRRTEVAAALGGR